MILNNKFEKQATFCLDKALSVNVLKDFQVLAISSLFSRFHNIADAMPIIAVARCYSHCMHLYLEI